MMELTEMTDVVFLKNELLAPYTSVHLGGPADVLAIPQSIDALASLLALLRQEKKRHFVLGNGSNTLFADAGYRGTVVLTTGLREMTFMGNTVEAACGVPLTKLAQEAAKRGLSGLAFACGIPGTVGGAIAMNAGAFGHTVSDALLSGTVLSPGGSILTVPAAAFSFSYRESRLQQSGEILLSATFALENADPAAVKAENEHNLAARRDKQPLAYPSLGSTFKRPTGHYAGQLIEEAGLKGTRVGNAEVSEKHAGFLLNRGATSADYLALITLVTNRVKEHTGITLEPEIIIVPET